MSDSWRPCLLAPAALALFTVPGENMRPAHVLTRHSKSRVRRSRATSRLQGCGHREYVLTRRSKSRVRRSRATSRLQGVWAPGIRVILTF